MKINKCNPIENIDIQIVPLIDVVFCILTFFLLAALQFTRQQVIEIDLPQAFTGNSPEVNLKPDKRNVLPITINAIGQVFIERESVTKKILGERLKHYLTKNPQGLIILHASRSSTYNDVIATLDILRQAGGDHVALGVIPGSPEKFQ
ncbi:Biopolymer transport protein ExbD/TolR [Richelia intracellularis HH01]|uniref:Biopolymer transport protein ExbD/TolR n=1 Tax=Richelia intracellularis HH01 TaxID=1165094 RepID=M1WZN0_9NOST|nr:biopolymer transporter ExbD [Richelia intracellularis]CCH67717.1 Biopolymer transport protein ExbD/TolR [Richelia intracellularis HH01]